MPIHEYKVTLFLEIDSRQEESVALVEEAVRSLFDEAIEGDEARPVCGLIFHDVNDVTAKKT
jgi:hypothetical protein